MFTPETRESFLTRVNSIGAHGPIRNRCVGRVVSPSGGLIWKSGVSKLAPRMRLRNADCCGSAVQQLLLFWLANDKTTAYAVPQ